MILDIKYDPYTCSGKCGTKITNCLECYSYASPSIGKVVMDDGTESDAPKEPSY